MDDFLFPQKQTIFYQKQTIMNVVTNDKRAIFQQGKAWLKVVIYDKLLKDEKRSFIFFFVTEN